MRCEVVAIGTELLLGQIVDTNSSWIGEQLALGGIDCLHQTKVGDNRDRIVAAIREGLGRADAVICCGGLGPTHDDITREAIAEVMGVELVTDHEALARIESMFAGRGRAMPANNKRQAEIPDGASLIEQQPGTAPGLVCPVGDQVVYAVPGVPYEMQEMVTGTVLADLRRRGGQSSVIRSRVVRTWGQSESALAELLEARIGEIDGAGTGGTAATLAFLASGIEGIKVRVTAKAPTAEEAGAVVDAEVAVVAALLGDMVFSTDDETMETVVLRLLVEQGLTVGVAESVTGGLITARLTDVPGASDALRGGLVAYDGAVKHHLLAVPGGPVVSDDAARAMAEGVCELLGTDVGLATTGVAGPTRQEGVPVGTVHVGTCVDGESAALMLRLPGDRERIRQFATISALDLLRRQLLAR
jgi:nicotinamide-nucleotide amidase